MAERAFSEDENAPDFAFTPQNEPRTPAIHPRYSFLFALLRRFGSYVGTQPFGPLNLLTRRPVHIPRPETEDWTIRLADFISSLPKLPRKRVHLDIGTGTGCIPLLLCHLVPQGTLTSYGVDISPQAIALADENAKLHNIPAVSGKNTFVSRFGNVQSSRFIKASGIQLPVDILTSNPPYIAWSERDTLPESVYLYEDPRSLYGGQSGLEFYSHILRKASLPGFLGPNAIVAFEVGSTQASEVLNMVKTICNKVDVWLDPWGKERVVVGFKTGGV